MLVLASTEFDPMTGSVLLALGAVVMLVLASSGVLSDKALAEAPQRRGTLSVFDILVALMLMMLGPSLGLMLARGLGYEVTDASLAMTIITHVGLLPVIGYCLVRGQIGVKGGVSEFGLGLRRTRLTIGTIIFGVPAMLAIILGLSQILLLMTVALDQTPPEIAHPTLEALAKGIFGPREIALAVSALVLAPLFEEIIFRGLFQTALVHTGAFAARWSPVLLISLLFTMFHISAVIIRDERGNFEQFAWQALVTLFVLSLCLGYVYERTGSLWPSIVMHAAFNALNIGVVVLRSSMPAS